MKQIRLKKLKLYEMIMARLYFVLIFLHENESQWVSSKNANRKYPQAVIAFWEHHVEFT